MNGYCYFLDDKMGAFADFRLGNFESAQKLYSEAFKRNPKSVRLLCNRSLCFLKQGMLCFMLPAYVFVDSVRTR